MAIVRNTKLSKPEPERKYRSKKRGLSTSISKNWTDQAIRCYKSNQNCAECSINSGNYSEIPVIAADTVVALGNEVIGKPKDRADAERILAELSGKTHQVYTGTAIFYRGKVSVFSVKTDVEFKTLSKREIDAYCDTDEPYDKAGAYAIQGKASFMVKRINGSYSNVVGLPVCEVIEHLQELGFLEK